MKQIIISIIFLLAFSLPAFLVYAQKEESTSSSKLTPTSTPIPYQLPYPGILPDSPLYNLKAFRDRIVAFLISDSLKKAEFNLLQADKHLSAGVYLFDKNKKALAETTISKGINYFEEAIIKAEEAKKQGVDTKALSQRLSLSVRKQKEVITSMKKQAPKELESQYQTLLKRIEKLEENVDRL